MHSHGLMRRLVLFFLVRVFAVGETTIGNGHDKASRLQEWRRKNMFEVDQGRFFHNSDVPAPIPGNDETLELATHRNTSRAIITGASSNHFRSLQSLLTSVVTSTTESIVVFDLGLAASEVAELGEWSGVTYRKVSLEEYGQHVALLQVFAWKPVLIDIVLQEFEHALWLDAGCLLEQNAEDIFNVIHTSGIFLTAANSFIGQLTHRSMIERFEAQDLLQSLQVNGGVVGFSRSSEAYSSVLLPWRQCALELACIAPDGSTRSNHRQDQSALSILVRKQGRPVHELSDFSIQVHQDQDADIKFVHPANGSRVHFNEHDLLLGMFQIEMQMVCPPDVEECCLRGSLTIALDGEIWMRYPEQFWCKATVVDQSRNGQFFFHLEQEGGLVLVFDHGVQSSCVAELTSAQGKVTHRAESLFVPLFGDDDSVD